MLSLFAWPIHLLLKHGYLALFLWSVTEGEIGLMLSGWLASEGQVFTYKGIIAIAISGAIIGDFTIFITGKLFGKKAKKWLSRYKEKEEFVLAWFKKWGSLVIVFERFVYGTHIPALLTVGMSGYPFWKFMIFDIVGVVLWAFTFTSVGFYFGESAINIILFAQKNIFLVLFVILLIVLYRKGKNSLS